jgi:hypothetical protein
MIVAAIAAWRWSASSNERMQRYRSDIFSLPIRVVEGFKAEAALKCNGESRFG